MCFYTEATKPKAKELHNYVTPQYGIYWKKIGVHLGFTTRQLDTIQLENPRNITMNCNIMFIKWLERDTSASWDNFFKAFDLAMQSASK